MLFEGGGSSARGAARGEDITVCIEDEVFEGKGVSAKGVASEENIIVGVEDTVMIDGVVSDVRTRNPGLDNSSLYGSYVMFGGLNRITYFASTDKYLSGILIVQAKLPGSLRSRSSATLTIS